ncbi:tripartite tricarboxylate transporter substrate binding protein [Alicycliphilus denitrificans]|uniref:Tripartite tricarboxylate transporter substrate binding protein n=1 Tax=Alicycliphilus denitrificans TaxID=179636 RepID=A0A420KHE6_9BURK|nr:tripartite tricarboxylate transporter substrate binding protein [Alicycliphilus denitrificans]
MFGPANRRKFFQSTTAGAISAAAFGSALTPRCAWAQSSDGYPSRVIRVVVPFTPGGGTDVVGRALMEALSRELGQAIIVDNKPGGGTVIGSDLVAKAPADGYTLLLTTSALAINDSLVPKLPYKTARDITEVGLICTGPNVFVVRPDSPYRSVADLIQAAKARPGRLTYGSSGNGSSVHLAAELFKLMAQVDITHVPYRGAGPAYTDLMGGQIDFVVGTAGGVAKLVEAGKMRAIAVTSEKRTAAYKDIPTVAETLPGYAADVWYGIFAPAGTPPDVIAKLNAALAKAANAPAYKQRLGNEGLTVAVNSPAEMTRFMRAEEARWRKVVVEGKVSVD